MLDSETVIWYEQYEGLAADDSGGEIRTFRPGEDISGAIIWPGTSTETQVGGDLLIDSLTVMFLEWHPRVKAYDEMEARGQRYRVQGPPAFLHHPSVGFEVMTITLLRRQ